MPFGKMRIGALQRSSMMFRFVGSLLLKIIFMIALFNGALTSYLNLGALEYVTDVLLIFLLAMYVTGFSRKRAPWYVWTTIIFYAVAVLFSIIFNRSFNIVMLWSVRTYFRFYLALIFAIGFLREKDYEWFGRIADYAFWINAVLVVIQFFQGVEQDVMGGIFGTSLGVNATTIQFMIIHISIKLLQYTRKKISIFRLFLYLALWFAIFGLAEIKYGIFLLPMLCMAYFLMSNKGLKVRNIIVLIVIVICIPIGVTITAQYYPSFAEYFETDNFESIANSEHYASEYDMGRTQIFTFCPPLMKAWTNSDLSIIFGIGQGQAQNSDKFEFLSSDFYENYYYTNYHFFILAFLFIETGYLGIISYFSLYVTLAIIYVYYYKTKRQERYMVGALVVIGAFMLLPYNVSMRMTMAFPVFMFMGLPLACNTDNVFMREYHIFRIKRH